MPLTLTAGFRTHLAGELTTLCTLWDIERRDGAIYRFTDHDQDVVYLGNRYTAGIGYNRSAVEDKHDMSVDNMEVQGILDTTLISRDDVRAGLFDGALVTLTVVNYADLSTAGVIRRRGWFGEVKQNNRGEFNVELRGLSQALSEPLTDIYTPGCRVDLGSPRCQVPLSGAADRQDDTYYSTGQWIRIPEYPTYPFNCVKAGLSEGGTSYNPAIYAGATPGDLVVDGDAYFIAYYPFSWAFTVTTVTNKRTFFIDVNASPLTGDSSYFDGGLVTFGTGENAGVSREVSTFTRSGLDGTVNLYLRMPFEIQVGDTGTIYPGCPKSVAVCKSRFGNVVNFQGFPHLPGDKYLKDYPDTK